MTSFLTLTVRNLTAEGAGDYCCKQPNGTGRCISARRYSYLPHIQTTTDAEAFPQVVNAYYRGKMHLLHHIRHPRLPCFATMKSALFAAIRPRSRHCCPTMPWDCSSCVYIQHYLPMSLYHLRYGQHRTHEHDWILRPNTTGGREHSYIPNLA
jgi:hypothetical protein